MRLDEAHIDAYLSGALDPAEKAEMDALLEKSPDHREQVEHARELRAWLRAAAPEVPSERIWANIRERVIQGEVLAAPAPALEAGLWERLAGFWTKPSPALRWGFAGAAALLLVVVGIKVGRHNELPSVPALSTAVPMERAPEPVAAPELAAVEPAHAQQKSEKAPAPSLARRPDPATPSGPTEVERALADQQLDDVIGSLLAQRDAGAIAPVAARPMMARSAGSQNVNFAPGEPAPYERRAGAAAMDNDGFWNFQPAALALNARNWNDAAVELETAAKSAPEVSERSFASSALQLLAQPGQPLANRTPVVPVEPDPKAGLTVLYAGRWQYFTQTRTALYANGVSARMPGLRSDGPGLRLDISFDRASFA
ncbi:MAG: hypothetical protein V4498_06140, partial [candidate division FCPU426 bacterium]